MTTLAPDTLVCLRSVPVFDRWIDNSGEECLRQLARGEEIRREAGEWVVHEGDPAAFYLVLQGEVRVMKMVGDSEMLLTVHKPGVFFGEIPLMMGSNFVAGGQAAGDVVAYRLDEDVFWALFSSCPGIAREITSTMAFRMQNLESISQTREKLAALGTLAAGLAHELNNPAAAAKRAASQLREVMREVENRAIEMHTLGFAPPQCSLLKEMRETAFQTAKTGGVHLSAMQRADREDEVADWLERRAISDGYRYAPTFVSAALPLDYLQDLSQQVECDAFSSVVTWLEASLRADGLAGEIEKSSEAISALVGSVKSYSHLDQGPSQEVEVHEGLDSTLLMLKYKLRGVEIEKHYDRNLPRLLAHGSELNQVWTNILDNAADALKQGDGAKPGAKISISTHRDAHSVVVNIVDNGPGIPKEIQRRIFEPFFTTKAVGSGTGLGLDIAHRIVVGRHGGDIKLQSDENGTSFTIRLPYGH